MSWVINNLVGRTFADLTVTGYAGRANMPKDRMPMWHCVCVCGAETVVRSALLTSGRTKSCGCLRARGMTTHGCGTTAEYGVWRSMKQRCLNPKSHSYPRYGGRGIIVCPEWTESFEAFVRDMGMRPTASHSIDRIDNDGNYEPGNCRWATRREQQNNISTNRAVEIGGRHYPSISAAARAANVHPHQIRKQLENKS